MTVAYAQRAGYCRDYMRGYMAQRRADPEKAAVEKLRREARRQASDEGGADPARILADWTGEGGES